MIFGCWRCGHKLNCSMTLHLDRFLMKYSESLEEEGVKLIYEAVGIACKQFTMEK